MLKRIFRVVYLKMLKNHFYYIARNISLEPTITFTNNLHTFIDYINILRLNIKMCIFYQNVIYKVKLKVLHIVLFEIIYAPYF